MGMPFCHRQLSGDGDGFLVMAVIDDRYKFLITDIYSLFLKAVKAISLMTSNTVFYSQLEGDIRAIYGHGLLDPLPLQIGELSRILCLIKVT